MAKQIKFSENRPYKVIDKDYVDNSAKNFQQSAKKLSESFQRHEKGFEIQEDELAWILGFLRHTNLICANCKSNWAKDKTVKFSRCGRCHHVYYCSKECQKTHWKEHKPNCKEFVREENK